MAKSKRWLTIFDLHCKEWSHRTTAVVDSLLSSLILPVLPPPMWKIRTDKGSSSPDPPSPGEDQALTRLCRLPRHWGPRAHLETGRGERTGRWRGGWRRQQVAGWIAPDKSDVGARYKLKYKSLVPFQCLLCFYISNSIYIYIFVICLILK